MFFDEVLFVYGQAQLQTFYGPFETADARDKYAEFLKQREEECFQANVQLDREGLLDHAGQIAELTRPSHHKHIPHEGPLPEGDWEKCPTETEGVFFWSRQEDTSKFLEEDLRSRGLGNDA